MSRTENELAILVAYFVVIIIIIPVVVGLWWRNSSKFLEDGVMQNTAYRFYKQLQENTATKYIPGVLASACEFQESIPCKNSQAQDIGQLVSASPAPPPPPPRRRRPCRRAPLLDSTLPAHARRLRNQHRRVSENFVKNQGDINNDIMKVKTLMYAHLLREKVGPSLEADMETVLENVHNLLNGLLNISMEQR